MHRIIDERRILHILIKVLNMTSRMEYPLPVTDLDLTGSQGTTRWSPSDWFVTFKMKAILESVPGVETGKTGSRDIREKSPDQQRPYGL